MPTFSISIHSKYSLSCIVCVCVERERVQTYDTENWSPEVSIISASALRTRHQFKSIYLQVNSYVYSYSGTEHKYMRNL